jgi:hypothetical protein
VITAKRIYGAGTNVGYDGVEVVEIDGMEGDDEFFVQSTEFGVAYRVIGGLGSDTINVTGAGVEDIVTRELEGASGSVDHLVSSSTRSTAVLSSTVSTTTSPRRRQAMWSSPTGGFTAVREGGPVTIDSYMVRLAVAPTAPVMSPSRQRVRPGGRGGHIYPPVDQRFG